MGKYCSFCKDLKNKTNSLQSYYIKCDVNLFQTSCNGTKNHNRN